MPVTKPRPLIELADWMKENGVRQRDWLPLFGHLEHPAMCMSALLAGHRRLTVPIMQTLHYEYGVPLEVLVPPPERKV